MRGRRKRGNGEMTREMNKNSNGGGSRNKNVALFKIFIEK